MDFMINLYYIIMLDKKLSMDYMVFYMDFSNMAKLPIYKEERFRSPLNTECDIGLWVDRIGSKTTSEKASRLRQLGQYGAVYIEKGQGCLINSKMVEFPIKPGDLILLFPNEASAYYPFKSWSEKWIVWNGPDAYKIEELGYLDKSSSIIHDDFGIFSQTFDSLSRIIDRENKAAILERANIILNMILDLFKMSEKANLNKDQDNAIGDAILFLQKNFAKKIPISELAENFNFSDTHFRRLFRNYTGRSPREFVTTLRISKAKELLAENRGIKEIAKIIGYEDVFYFMRVFKTVTGSSPGKWQKNLHDHSVKA
jgi:AraC-like DNA-binding protein